MKQGDKIYSIISTFVGDPDKNILEHTVSKVGRKFLHIKKDNFSRETKVDISCMREVTYNGHGSSFYLSWNDAKNTIIRHRLIRAFESHRSYHRATLEQLREAAVVLGINIDL